MILAMVGGDSNKKRDGGIHELMYERSGTLRGIICECLGRRRPNESFCGVKVVAFLLGLAAFVLGLCPVAGPQVRAGHLLMCGPLSIRTSARWVHECRSSKTSVAAKREQIPASRKRFCKAGQF